MLFVPSTETLDGPQFASYVVYVQFSAPFNFDEQLIKLPLPIHTHPACRTASAANTCALFRLYLEA